MVYTKKRKKNEFITELMSNYTGVMSVASSIAHSTMSAIPVPEYYPPSFVLVPSRKKPFLKIMHGKEYYKELLHKRGRV